MEGTSREELEKGIQLSNASWRRYIHIGPALPLKDMRLRNVWACICGAEFLVVLCRMNVGPGRSHISNRRVLIGVAQIRSDPISP